MAFLLRRSTPRFYTNVAKEAKIIPDPWHGSYHWIYERGLSVATLGLVGAAAVGPTSGAVNMLLGVVLPLHCHIGFGTIITDYLPARKFPTIYKLSMGLLYAATATTLYGLYLYNTRDIGITEGFKTLWRKNKSEDK